MSKYRRPEGVSTQLPLTAAPGNRGMASLLVTAPLVESTTTLCRASAAQTTTSIDFAPPATSNDAEAATPPAAFSAISIALARLIFWLRRSAAASAELGGTVV